MKKVTTFLALLMAAVGLGISLEGAGPARKATVVTTANETVEGEFQGASDTGVALRIAGQRLVVPWDSISQLSFVGRPALAQTGNLPSVSSPSALPPSSQNLTQTPGAQPNAPPSAPGRCQAITKKGTQCSRKAKPGSNYCWQHGG